MAKTKKIEEVIVEEIIQNTEIVPTKTEKEKLLDLYQQLKDLGINSIGDLEVKISRAE